MCKTGQEKNLTYSSLWAKERDFLSFDQLIDEESMDFFQSDEYLMMSKHLNPSLSEGKVSFQVSLLFLVFGPLNQTGRLSGLASQPVPQTLGPQEDMKIWRGKYLRQIQNNVLAFFFDRLTCSQRSKEQLRFSALLCTILNFRVFCHVFISSLDMFKNCINSYRIYSEQVYTC